MPTFKERRAEAHAESLPLRGYEGEVYKGTEVPSSRVPKGKFAETKLPLAAGNKEIKCQHLGNGEASDIGPAPAHRRIYDRDYSKVRPSPDDTDLVTQELGNPLRW